MPAYGCCSVSAVVPNPSKRKGDAFERLIRDYLAEEIDCERIPAGATLDRGDLWSRQFCIQAKACRSWSVHSWLTQAEEQQANAGKPYHALLLKLRGVAAPDSQAVVMRANQFRALVALLEQRHAA